MKCNKDGKLGNTAKPAVGDEIRVPIWKGYKFREKDRPAKKQASDKAWSLLCGLEYLLQERDSKSITVSKHMLDMTLAHIAREVHDIYELIKIVEVDL